MLEQEASSAKTTFAYVLGMLWNRMVTIQRPFLHLRRV